MRNAAKAWDELPLQPIRLKQRLAEAGKTQAWLAQQVTKRGYEISRVTMWCVINKQYKTTRHDELRKIVEEVLLANNISTAGVWLTLPGAETRMRKIRADEKFKHRTGERAIKDRGYSIRLVNEAETKEEVAEMNYTKAFLDDDVLEHFGLESDPFYDIVDFTDIWVSPRHKVLERRVYDTIRRHSIMAMIGDIGAGKTTFLRYILGKMVTEKTVKIIFPDRLNRKLLNGDSLTQAVLTQLGAQRIPRSAVDKDALAKRLLEECVKMGTNPVLILDEAHDLQEEAFIALKRLWDSGMIFKLLSIILVGQGGLDSKNCSFGLKYRLEENPWIREFSERCYMVDVGTLTGSMAQYLGFRFKKVGGDVNKVFTDKGLQILAKRADVPQLANNIAIRAMTNAYRDGKTQVGPEHVAEA